jgi:protein O-GlcNAc transferase
VKEAPSVSSQEISRQFALGADHMTQGRYHQASECFRRVLDLRPDYAEAYNNLGTALLNCGRIDEAFAAYQRAIEIKPQLAGAFFNLGTAFQKIGSLDVAISCYQRAVELDPTIWEAHTALGIAWQQQGKCDDAVAAYNQSLRLAPDQALTHSNLSTSLREQGRLDEAISACCRALQLDPTFATAHSNLVYLTWFHPAYDSAAIYEEHRRWNQQHAAESASSIAPHRNDRNENRRLRVGYVSPEFRQHCQSLFTIPLLTHHNHHQFEIFCYSDVTVADGFTNIVRSYSNNWRDTATLGNDQLAELVRQDKIDILVDLTMHMSGSRALLFAKKPAPIQVCWLAYPGTTGLTTIDYRLTDPYLDPTGQDDRFYSEASIRLPDTFWCYWPFDNQPEPNALPALTDGCITFGSLNNFSKVNPFVLKLWAEVLTAVPNSRLALLAPPGWAREQTLGWLGRFGVAAERVRFFDRQPVKRYMSLYHQIDIGLDTFPYNGHTTSLDSFWMGVPVITIVGKTVVGRAGLSQLTNLALPEFIARSPEEYVSIASSLASNLTRLSLLRSTLRDRMQQSPLMNAPKFAVGVEAAYRQMWHKWCQSKVNRTEE